MGLETGTYISDLVSTNPLGSDLKSEGDDHLRLIKATVKATFPNISGAVTPTHTELNYVDGVTSAIQTQMDLKAPLASPTFTGNPIAPTAAQFDTDTSIATTAYAMQIGMRSNGVAAYTATDTLTVADAGRACYYNSASAGTLTLPAASAVPVGTIIPFYNFNTGALTIARAGSDTIYGLGSTAVTSIVLQKTDAVMLKAQSGAWVQVTGNNGLGVGQTWQDVAASRAASTTYTNSTGKPIEVVISLLSSAATTLVATVSGIDIPGTTASATGLSTFISLVIPNGGTYSVVNNVGTSTVADWAELRS